MPSNIPFWEDALLGAHPSIPDAPFGVSAWDFVVLGTPAGQSASAGMIVLPGVCEVDVEKDLKLDIKPSAGSNGATVTQQGYDPAKITIALSMWSANQWNIFLQQLPQLEPAPYKAQTSQAAAFGIGHPLTAARGITSIVIQKIVGPKKTGQQGVRQVVFNCVEWFKPNPALSATSTLQTSIPAFANIANSGPPAAPSTTATPNP